MNYFDMLYRLAISLWAGGNAIFTLMLTPILFTTESRDVAGRIVGNLFPGYFRWGLVCGVIALLCRVAGLGAAGGAAVRPSMPWRQLFMGWTLQQKQQRDDDQEGQADDEEDAVEGQHTGLPSHLAVHHSQCCLIGLGDGNAFCDQGLF